MDRFLNALKQHAAALDAGQGRVRIGTVQSVNPGDHTARVLIQPEGVLTGWLPILAAQLGLAVPPPQGAQVLVEAQEGDGEHGVITGILYSDASRPPTIGGAAAAAGEFLFVNPAGNAIYLSNDGKVLLQDAHGSKVQMTNDGSIVLTGTVNVVGLLKVNGTTVTVP